MSSDKNTPPVIEAHQLGKRYVLAGSPYRHLWHLLGGTDRGIQYFHALSDVNLQVRKGESIGLIGQNGAGKSTLLQLLCGTLSPTQGQLQVQGRVAALLELGAGFNPDFTGRENIRFSAALYGMDARHIEDHIQEIIDFAEIGDFIDHPVRTYSSGMYVRLAFSIATSVQPDILVIDEALAVGDGLFARKSFDRIMRLKEQGVTLLFCSHSLFQVEALCDRCAWLHKGQVMAQGASASVIAQYNDWLGQQNSTDSSAPQTEFITAAPPLAAAPAPVQARFVKLQVQCDGTSGTELHARSGQSELCVDLVFDTDPQFATPNLAVMIYGADGRIVCSTGTWIDGFVVTRQLNGRGYARVSFPCLPLLKGSYSVAAYLMCERALHVYQAVEHFATVLVSQPHLEQGIVSIPHQWSNVA